MLNDKNDIILSQQVKIDELQKRIDEALESMDDGDFDYCIKLLKGNQDEK